jgi:hypothetical protein
MDHGSSPEFSDRSYHCGKALDITTHSSILLGGRRRRYHKTTPPWQHTNSITMNSTAMICLPPKPDTQTGFEPRSSVLQEDAMTIEPRLIYPENCAPPLLCILDILTGWTYHRQQLVLGSRHQQSRQRGKQGDPVWPRLVAILSVFTG